MLLVVRLHAGTATGHVLQATSLKTDQIQSFVLVQATARAGEVVDLGGNGRMRIGEHCLYNMYVGLSWAIHRLRGSKYYGGIRQLKTNIHRATG